MRNTSINSLKKLITVDVRRANARVIGELPRIQLSAEDAALVERIKKICGPIKDSPKLRQIFHNAMSRYSDQAILKN